MGDFFSAGRTNKKDQIQRGLVRFDLSGVPADSQIVSVSLRLRLVDYPQNDANPRRFWLIALTDAHLAEPWGEGTSARWLSEGQHGSGRGGHGGRRDVVPYRLRPDDARRPAEPVRLRRRRDTGTSPARWATARTPRRCPETRGPWWTATSTSTKDRNYYTWSTARMAAEVQGWVNGSATNFGWLLLGDETVTGTDASSKREFASREHANAAWRPTLTIEYAPVPEPAAWLLCLIGLATSAHVERPAAGRGNPWSPKVDSPPRV